MKHYVLEVSYKRSMRKSPDYVTVSKRNLDALRHMIAERYLSTPAQSPVARVIVYKQNNVISAAKSYGETPWHVAEPEYQGEMYAEADSLFWKTKSDTRYKVDPRTGWLQGSQLNRRL